ncbi:MAG: hypothetical protein LBL13_01285 [Bacteroidales bacterium]|jgi:hypothetical protein|nr:hypothetical protein [Bacteroidales bacterium]
MNKGDKNQPDTFRPHINKLERERAGSNELYSYHSKLLYFIPVFIITIQPINWDISNFSNLLMRPVWRYGRWKHFLHLWNKNKFIEYNYNNLMTLIDYVNKIGLENDIDIYKEDGALHISTPNACFMEMFCPDFNQDFFEELFINWAKSVTC